MRGLRHIKYLHGTGLWMVACAVAKPLGATWVTLQAGRSCPLVWEVSLQPCPCLAVLLSPSLCCRETLNSAGPNFLDQPSFLFLKLAQRVVVVFTYVPEEGGSLGRVSRGVKNSSPGVTNAFLPSGMTCILSSKKPEGVPI